jgi:DNA-binding MarR family transcriptional regulator
MLGEQPKTSLLEILLLHARADRALRARLAGQLDEHNLTIMEWLLLGVLSGGSREGLSISATAARLDVTLPQVTALIASLFKKRLVRLRTQKRDRRSRHAALTAKGENVLERTEEAIGEVLRRWPVGVSRQQAAAYVAMITAMAEQSRRSPAQSG